MVDTATQQQNEFKPNLEKLRKLQQSASSVVIGGKVCKIFGNQIGYILKSINLNRYFMFMLGCTKKKEEDYSQNRFN